MIPSSEAAAFLSEQDRLGGINNTGPILGQPKLDRSTSLAEESPWKLLDLTLLPSSGKMYAAGSEIAIRSAKTREIRHWSTIDDGDPISVREKIGFILNACLRFYSENRTMSFEDILEIDKYYILFRIHELTFPNQENKMFAVIKCSDPECGSNTRVQVTSSNLSGFKYPEELLKWLVPEERCFKIVSERLGETLRFNLPTIGATDFLKNKRREDTSFGHQADDAFYKHSPYLLGDWRQMSAHPQIFQQMKLASMNSWSIDKFSVVDAVVKKLEANSINRVKCVCEKCRQLTESHIFLGGSFTIRDLFVVPARLDELV